MKRTGLFVLLLVLGCVVLPHRSPAPIVVREGEGSTYVAPGAEEVPNQKDAQAQFDVAFAKETAGDVGSASRVTTKPSGASRSRRSRPRRSTGRARFTRRSAACCPPAGITNV